MQRAYDERIATILQGEFSVPNPMPKDWVQGAVSRGMLPKYALVNGLYYFGRCRNANVAKWDSKREVFTYMRLKFGKYFTEDINHPEDDNGMDLFVPVRIIEPKITEVV